MKNENYDTPFAVRLRELFRHSPKTGEKTTLSTMGEYLGVKFQTVSLWLNGKTTPEIKHLKPLADYFGVSIDYLLCNSDVMSSDTNTKEISEKYGLSEKTLKFLRNTAENAQSTDKNFFKLLNALFFFKNKSTKEEWNSNGEVLRLMYKYCFEEFKDIDTKKFVISAKMQEKFALEMVCDELTKLRENILRKK